MTKKKMMMNLITELGHEDNITVAFCNYAESHTLEETKGAYARAQKLIERRASREW
jgi:hypothetical protein